MLQEPDQSVAIVLVIIEKQQFLNKRYQFIGIQRLHTGCLLQRIEFTSLLSLDGLSDDKTSHMCLNFNSGIVSVALLLSLQAFQMSVLK